MEALPEELVAEVLARLAPRSLAASRCVCREWRAIIDGGRLLPGADLLPLRFCGLFCRAQEWLDTLTYFISPARRRIARRLDFLPAEPNGDEYNVVDHCNGLLLFWDCVANPATRQFVSLPPFPKQDPPPVTTTTIPQEELYHNSHRCLVYDPMNGVGSGARPHRRYQVFQIPLVPFPPCDDNDDRQLMRRLAEQSEWPPSPYTAQVFSSMTWRWEERSFLRQQGHPPAGTIADMWRCEERRFAVQGPVHVYFQEALYVLCPNGCVMRMALADDTYQMIAPPAAERRHYLGRSQEGVHYTVLDFDDDVCRIWLLIGTSSLEWVPRAHIGLQAMLHNFPYLSMSSSAKPWITTCYAQHQGSINDDNVDDEEQEPEEEEWDLDHSDVVILGSTTQEDHTISTVVPASIHYFLGLHPYKEVAFFLASNETVVSYHWNTSKVQNLGTFRISLLQTSFPYTPCWITDLMLPPGGAHHGQTTNS